MYKQSIVLVALLACATAASASRLLQQTSSTGCPINPSTQELDFSKVAASCGDDEDICTTCVCALVDVFTPALKAGGVAFDAEDPETFPLESAAGIIRSCAEQYLVSMLMANINTTALASLNSCTFTNATQVPACLATEVADLAGNATNVTASSRTGDDLSYDEDNLANVTLRNSTAGSALRVASVQAGPNGPQFELTGQLNSAGQLLDTMLASEDLLAAMTPAAVAQLRTLAADPSKIEANPATAEVLAELKNPINGVQLLTTMDELSKGAEPEVEAIATPVASPAVAAPAVPSTPAPKNGAGARGMAAAATVGAAMLAALLL